MYMINMNRRGSCFKSRPFYAQCLASTAKNLIQFNIGMCLGFPAIVIGETHDVSDSDLRLSNYQISLFAGILFICQPFGSLFSGPLVESFGRKQTLMLVNLPFFLSWLFMYMAKGPELLFLGAVLAGTCIGLQEAPTKTYSGEICQPQFRGILTAFGAILFTSGFFVVFLLGASLHWRTTAAVSSGFPVLTAICISMIPDSPQWLVSKGYISEAEKSLCWLRGWTKPPAVETELKQIIWYHISCRFESLPVGTPKSKIRNFIKNDTNNSSAEDSFKMFPEIPFYPNVNDYSWKRKLSLMVEPETRRPLTLVLACMVIHVTASGMGFHQYLILVSKELELPVSGPLVLILTGFNGIVSTAALMFVIARVGKRRLMVMSLTGTFLCSLLLGISVILLKTGYLQHSDAIGWITLALIQVNVSCVNIGVAPVPWMLVSEVFPFKTRGFASALSSAVDHLLNFAVASSFLPLQENIGLQGIFLLVSLWSFFGLIYVFQKLPETEGKTLEEIEIIFCVK